MSEIVKKGWNKYLLQLQLNPVRTEAITSGVLIGSSDIIAQKITGVKKLQFRRVLLLMVLLFKRSSLSSLCTSLCTIPYMGSQDSSLCWNVCSPTEGTTAAEAK
ncbi:unnamed protein product [Camellia sinensis]